MVLKCKRCLCKGRALLVYFKWLFNHFKWMDGVFLTRMPIYTLGANQGVKGLIYISLATNRLQIMVLMV